MEIRKLFNFNGMHIVRNCSSERCKYSLHSHTYTVEVFLTADGLDNGMMCADFGLLKGTIKDFVKSFDKSYSIWDKESDDFKDFISSHFDRIVTLPLSPSAEAYSLMMYHYISSIVENTEFNNGEKNVRVTSVRVHETSTGYAESTEKDLINPKMPKFDILDIKFSEPIIEEWKYPAMSEMIAQGQKFINPIVKQQI